MSKRTNPKCRHARSEVIVTNQPMRFDSSRSHASFWVCSRPGCVIDAMACVVEFTGEQAWRRTGTTGEWFDTMPVVA